MKKIIILFLAAITLGSCQKSLNIVNPDAVATQQFWKTASDAQLGVNAIYSTFHREGLSRWNFFATIIRADEGWSKSGDPTVISNYDQFVVSDYNYGSVYNNLWGDNYFGINRANQVLDNVPNINMDATLKAQYLGEAKFLRALFYYQLAIFFGNVPIQLKSSTLTDKPATSTQADVFAQIEQDCIAAAAALPVSYTGNDLGRATKGAANALLAKAYMQQHNYQAALAPLQAVVQSGVYSLMPNYQDNFLVTTGFNKESVFEFGNLLNPNDNHDDDTNTSAEDNLNYGSSLPPFFAPPQLGYTDGEARRWPIAEFEKETTTTGSRDPRLAVSLLFDSADVRGPNYTMIYGKTFASRYGTTNVSNDNFVWFAKFLNYNNGTAAAPGNFEVFHSANDYRFIRYADVLLMYAECLNATGATTNAYQYIDIVRKRANLSALSTVMPGLNQAQFLTQLKHERITELTGEGHRWDDLVRWGDLGPGLASRDAGFKNFVVGKNEFFPIPQREIDVNPNLKQNPGY
ncbi:MAG: RagB/SusD family nutrient uptake outer membrane protein [Janthinobacterium lividum]